MTSIKCSNATAPINIVSNLADTCDLKCNYSKNYTNTSVNAENKGEYIRYTFDTSNTPPVTFNAEQYNVSDMKLYQPSLHTYGGVKCDAEVIITHTNLTQNATLVVSVPILATGTSEGVMDSLITQVATRANSDGGKTTVGIPTFTLSNIVPSAPFYNYVGTLPVFPCTSGADYIVFDKPSAINIMSATLLELKKIITSNTYVTHTNSNGFFYNANGPSSGTSADGDDIYIECNPTGADGSVLVSQGTSTSSDINTDSIISFFKSPWVTGTLGAIILFILLYLFSKFFSRITSTTQVPASSSASRPLPVRAL